MTGTSLQRLENDALLYARQMKDLQRDSVFYFTEHYRQAFLNLQWRDNKENPTRLKGKVISSEEYVNCLDDKFLRPGLVLVEGMLLTYFGSHVECAEWTIKHGKTFYSQNVPGEFNLMWEAHLKGVSCFAAARQTGKKKYAKLGSFFLKRIQSWSKQGNPNVARFQTLLEAEELAWRGKKGKAIQKYEFAIVQSARGGFQHDAALASERLGDFHWSVMKDKEETKYRMIEACRYYAGWGAVAKCRALEEFLTTVLEGNVMPGDVVSLYSS